MATVDEPRDDSVRTERTERTQPVRTEPVRTEPVSTDTARTDTARTDTARTERFDDAGPAPAVAVGEADGTAAHRAEPELSMSRHDVVARQKEQFGGVKVGSAFFGWVVAIGITVLLTALITAVGAGIGLSQNISSADDIPADQQGTIGIVGAILVLVVVFVAYYCGGYVAGRMARFSPIRQGVAVWLWGLVVAVIVGIVGAVAGAQYNLFGRLGVFPRLPINEGQLTAAGIITAAVVVVVALLGALLGSALGIRYHRRIDKAGLGA